jgi:glyoxylase-like metal-dependent hydrolase (beta-lactamase superfamily II)
MESVVNGLYASAPDPLPFGPSLDIRAFLLPRDDGNLLIYSSPSVRPAADAIEDLGGIAHRYLNHRHEASFGCDAVAAVFDAPLSVHENERASVAETCTVHETFAERRMVGDDFEVIPTPGHTTGATAYLWDSGEHRYLFTGDTILLDEGEWVAAVLGSSDRAAYLDSLELIREIDFDVLVPWAATRGQEPYAVTSMAGARRRIDAIIERVRRGESG